MYYKKKRKYYKNLNNKNISTNCNFIIDSKGRKKFWLNRRVSKREFKFLKFKFNIVHKSWIFKNKEDTFVKFFIKNLTKLKNFFFFLFIKKCQKNIFANFSNIFGDVIYKTSSGFFHKRSLRKTFFATGFLLKKMQNIIVIRKLFAHSKEKQHKKTLFFLNIVGGNYQRGFKKNLKDFIKRGSSTFFKITEIKCKAHNGVRKSKRRRK